jgi:hypothetical protein
MTNGEVSLGAANKHARNGTHTRMRTLLEVRACFELTRRCCEVCQQTADEVKRANGAEELAEMKAFMISDATGPSAPHINGVFTKTDELKNDKPVFSKADSDGTTCCWFAPTNKWMVSPTVDKDVNKPSGYAVTERSWIAHPAVAHELWKAADGAQFVDQPYVSVRVLSASEVVRVRHCSLVLVAALSSYFF